MVCEKCGKEFSEDYRSKETIKRYNLPMRFCSASCRRASNASQSRKNGIDKIEKIKCDKCNFDILPNNFKRHYDKCEGKGPRSKREKIVVKGKSHEEIYGLKKSKELKENLSRIMKEKSAFKTMVWDEKRRKEQSERKKKLYLEHPEKHPNRKLANNKTKMSYPEKLIYEKLLDLGINFKHQKEFLNYFVDFYLPDFNLIVEVDGKYFHDEEHDKIRDGEIIKSFNKIKIIRLEAKNVLGGFKEKVENILADGVWK